MPTTVNKSKSSTKFSRHHLRLVSDRCDNDGSLSANEGNRLSAPSVAGQVEFAIDGSELVQAIAACRLHCARRILFIVDGGELRLRSQLRGIVVERTIALTGVGGAPNAAIAFMVPTTKTKAIVAAINAQQARSTKAVVKICCGPPQTLHATVRGRSYELSTEPLPTVPSRLPELPAQAPFVAGDVATQLSDALIEVSTQRTWGGPKQFQVVSISRGIVYGGSERSVTLIECPGFHAPDFSFDIDLARSASLALYRPEGFRYAFSDGCLVLRDSSTAASIETCSNLFPDLDRALRATAIDCAAVNLDALERVTRVALSDPFPIGDGPYIAVEPMVDFAGFPLVFAILPDRGRSRLRRGGDRWCTSSELMKVGERFEYFEATKIHGCLALAPTAEGRMSFKHGAASIQYERNGRLVRHVFYAEARRPAPATVFAVSFELDALPTAC